MSSEVCYVGNYQDPFVRLALRELARFDGAREEPLGINELAPHGSVLVISSRGRFPSRYIRIVQLYDAERRGIERPKTAENAKWVLAVNAGSGIVTIVQHISNLREALLGTHCKISERPHPVTTRKASRRATWEKRKHERVTERYARFGSDY